MKQSAQLVHQGLYMAHEFRERDGVTAAIALQAACQ
jgi:hypothetical protein